MIVVTFALPAESREFLRLLSCKSRADRNGFQTIRGKIDDRTIEVFHTGVGEKMCRQRLGKFLPDAELDCLVSSGFAGALNDNLKIGDLFAAQNFSTLDLGDRCSSISGSGIHIGDLLTVSAMLDSSQERTELARASGAAAVDMETEFIAKICADKEIPLLSLRVISDTPLEPFPAPAAVLFDIERQRTSVLKLASYLLAHPNRVRRLARFAGNIAQARKTLADALVTILKNL